MKTAIALAIAIATAAAPHAHAQDGGSWQLKVGVHAVDPKSGNGTLAAGTLSTDVGTGVSPTVTLEYHCSPNLGIELLAALPFEHTVRLNGAKSASVKQLPPTLSLQWHFMPGARFDPFVGVGLNYTRFFSIKEKGPLDGAHLDLSDSWGVATHAGVDYALDDRWSLSADVRWIKIASDAKVNGAKVGTVHIDPLTYGFAVGYRF